MARNRTLGRETSNGRIGGRSRISIAGARELRREMTPAENILWQALRRHQLGGMHFRRQHPVGPFVLDFACAAHRLAVEVDGAIHAVQEDQDQARTDLLSEYGWRVVRFTNDDVMNRLPWVLETIEYAVTARSSSPSPDSGRGEHAGNALDAGKGKNAVPIDSRNKALSNEDDFRRTLPSPALGGGAGGGGRSCSSS